MIINLIESKFEVGPIKEHMLYMEPTEDMNYIEEVEAHFDKIGMPYALVECRTIVGKITAKKKNVFLGWSLITELPLWNSDKHNEVK